MNPCQDLEDFLSGNLEPAYFSEIDSYRQHWEECPVCQRDFPNAKVEIQNAESYALSQIREHIGHLCREYTAAKNKMLQPPPPRKPEAVKLAVPHKKFITFVPPAKLPNINDPTEQQKLYKSLLVMLGEKGDEVRELLQIMNDNWGLDYFRVVLANASSSSEYDSRFCGSLISSLREDVQRFVFQSLLAADILESLDIESSPQSSCKLYKTVEFAAPEFLRVYLEEQKLLMSAQVLSGSTSPQDQKDLSVLMDKIDHIAVNVNDGIDSLKAVQMEWFRRSKPSTYDATEIEEDLVNLLGKSLYESLTPDTRRYLNRGESLFRQSLHAELKDFRASLIDFNEAYNHEFRNRISGPVARILLESGNTNYPVAEDKVKFVKDGKFNGRLTLGEQIHFLVHDEHVRNIVGELNVSVKDVLRCASRIRDVRNNAAHPDRPTVSESDVRNVRDTLRDGLGALFPKGPSS